MYAIRSYYGQKLTIPPSPASVLNEGKSTQTTSTSESGYYTVKNGDTLWQIAQDNGVSVSEIKRLNNMKSNNLKVGQRLKIKS